MDQKEFPVPWELNDWYSFLDKDDNYLFCDKKTVGFICFSVNAKTLFEEPQLYEGFDVLERGVGYPQGQMLWQEGLFVRWGRVGRKSLPMGAAA